MNLVLLFDVTLAADYEYANFCFLSFSGLSMEELNRALKMGRFNYLLISILD